MQSIEKHSFKISIGIAITVAMFLVHMSTRLAAWKTTVEMQQVAIDNQYAMSQARTNGVVKEIEVLQAASNAQDVVMTEVKTKLSSIEFLLLEMREERKV